MRDDLRRYLVVLVACSFALFMGCTEDPPNTDDDDAADDDAADDDDAVDDDAADDDAADDDDDTNYIIILISSLSTDVQYFEYDSDGVIIKYFAVLDSDGDPHVAFDACDNCYPAKLGYSQVGDVMKCNNCGNTYAIDEIGTTSEGGCWPGYLENEVVGDEIRIAPATLDAGSYYFE